MKFFRVSSPLKLMNTSYLQRFEEEDDEDEEEADDEDEEEASSVFLVRIGCIEEH